MIDNEGSGFDFTTKFLNARQFHHKLYRLYTVCSAAFLNEFAPRHGFKVIRNGEFWEFWHEVTRKILVFHDADTLDEKCITCRVVKNLHVHRDELRQRLAS